MTRPGINRTVLILKCLDCILCSINLRIDNNERLYRRRPDLDGDHDFLLISGLTIGGRSRRFGRPACNLMSLVQVLIVSKPPGFMVIILESPAIFLTLIITLGRTLEWFNLDIRLLFQFRLIF